MNCRAFQFVTPQIDVQFDYYSSTLQINGSWEVTQTFSPPKRLQNYIAGCDYGETPPITLWTTKTNWQPFSDDAFCNRFALKSMNGRGPTQFSVNRYQYMGSTPITGSNGSIYFIKPASFYDGSGITPAENWWSYEKLKPWDAADPFYARNLACYNAMANKTFDMAVLGGSPLIVNGNITVSFSALLTFTQNGTDGYAVNTSPTFTAVANISNMTFTRGQDYP
jgi:hypothetical protein